MSGHLEALQPCLRYAGALGPAAGAAHAAAGRPAPRRAPAHDAARRLAARRRMVASVSTVSAPATWCTRRPCSSVAAAAARPPSGSRAAASCATFQRDYIHNRM